MSTQSQSIIHTSDGDQRDTTTVDHSHAASGPRFEEGKEGSHKDHDVRDERSIANKLAAASDNTSNNRKAGKEDNPDLPNEGDKPTDLAERHGNKPSKGAKIDAEIEAEEAELLAKKDAKK